MIWFVIASISPGLLLIGAAIAGGSWAWLSLGYMTLCVYIMDRLGRTAPSAPAASSRLAASALSVLLALLHILLVVLCLKRVPDLGLLDATVTTLTLGLFMGQVSHPNAHELIHHGTRSMRRLGLFIYSSMLIGHHVSAHLRVHHVHVATRQDPNSARAGEGFYRFWLRAWTGSFARGLAAENRARNQRDPRPSPLSHPYLSYVVIALAMCALAWVLSGTGGLVVLLAASFYGQMQIFLADYVQHYGLRRNPDARGKPEPVGPGHSWNAPHWYSSAMMLNAPRHSDHHLNPKRRFPELQLRSDMPVLPYSLPVMSVIALLPPIWRRLMDRRARALQAVG